MMHPLDIGFNRVPSQWFWNNWRGKEFRPSGYVLIEPANKGTGLRFRVPWEHFVQPVDQLHRNRWRDYAPFDAHAQRMGPLIGWKDG